MAETPEIAPTLDQTLLTALHFAQANGPHHPGSLPRFPVPSERNSSHVEVPLAILAVDDAGRRGLYTPARVVLLAYPSGEPTGIADFPGFDPDAWPPPRLGDWPPSAIRDLDPRDLQAMVARFGAAWHRLLESWFSGTGDDRRANEAADALELLDRLDPPAMAEVYERLNPRFWAWMQQASR